jgi:hypothetical protein
VAGHPAWHNWRHCRSAAGVACLGGHFLQASQAAVHGHQVLLVCHSWKTGGSSSRYVSWVTLSDSPLGLAALLLLGAP